MKTWTRLTAIRGEEEGGKGLKEGEGISQRIYIKDPWTWTIVWGWTVEVRGGLSRLGQRGKIGTTVMAKTKYFLKKK